MADEEMKLILGSVFASVEGRREYMCRFVKAGRVRAAGNRVSKIEVTPEALQKAAARGLFNKKAVFVDHAGWFDYPSIRNLAGVTFEAFWDMEEQAIKGKIRLYTEAKSIAALLDEVLAEGEAGPDIGLSIAFWPVFAPREKEDDPLRIVDIRHVESVDLVFEPAADGRVIEALSSYRTGGVKVLDQDQLERVEGSGSEESEEKGWAEALSSTAAQAMIAASDLPEASKERLAGQSYDSPEAVRQAIVTEREYLGKLASANVVQLGGVPPRSPQISMGLDGLEQVQLATDGLLAGTRPEKGVAPLSGIRELYTILSGDYEMTGVFHGERVTLANVNCSTMAGLVANALNKRVVNMFQEYPRWWERFVSAEDFATLQQVKWITLGGVGELPTVAEGAAYTELTWDDMTETANFVKKGGYLGITIEAIDKDDTRRLQAAPRALAQAAWLTLSKAISAIFTANSGVGPTMSDSLALFHTTHANLGTTALSWTSYAAARTAMRKQTELNSSERLGALTAPKFLLVPPDLEITAMQVLASEYQYTYALSNGPAAPVKPMAEGDGFQARMNAARDRVVVVDLWTDTNDWAAVADPLLYPSIGLGFRYGRTPEIFSVASPTAGLMFTNDTLPVKVRFFFATGPTDYRGLYKANVS